MAAELGYDSRQSVHRAVRSILAETARANGTEVLRAQQLVELAELRRRMWLILQNPPPAVDRLGRVLHDENGQVIPDAHAAAEAASVILRAAEGWQGYGAWTRRSVPFRWTMATLKPSSSLRCGEVDKLGGERTADERSASIISVSAMPPDG